MNSTVRLVAANLARSLLRWLLIAVSTITLLGVSEWINAR